MDIRIYCPQDFPSHLPHLQELYEDLFNLGKGFRPKLVQKVCEHLKLPEKEVLLISQSVEFIHNGSLLHDDLRDRSHLRRGKPAAWYKYSPEYAVLAGDYLLTRTVINIAAYGNKEFIVCSTKTIGDLVEGEWIQDSLLGRWDVDLETWDLVHRLKTGSLFKLCLTAPFLCQERYDENLQSTLDELGMLLGLLFQRSDDLLDFGVRNHENKIVLGDLNAGYLNSFGTYLLKDWTPEQRAELKDCLEIGPFKEAVGEKRFQQSVENFDQINRQLIKTYHHNLKNLALHLKPEELGLMEDLAGLPEVLYWRKDWAVQ